MDLLRLAIIICFILNPTNIKSNYQGLGDSETVIVKCKSQNFQPTTDSTPFQGNIEKNISTPVVTTKSTYFEYKFQNMISLLKTKIALRYLENIFSGIPDFTVNDYYIHAP